jgi:hypothetical protein
MVTQRSIAVLFLLAFASVQSEEVTALGQEPVPVSAHRDLARANVKLDPVEKISQTFALLQAGALTKSEFEQLKSQALAVAPSAPAPAQAQQVPVGRWRTQILGEGDSGDFPSHVDAIINANDTSLSAPANNVVATDVTPTEDDRDDENPIDISETTPDGGSGSKKFIMKWNKRCMRGRETYQSNSKMIAFACPYEDVEGADGAVIRRAGAIYVKYDGQPLERVISEQPRVSGNFGKTVKVAGRRDPTFFLAEDTLVVVDRPLYKQPFLKHLREVQAGKVDFIHRNSVSIKRRGQPLDTVRYPVSDEELISELRVDGSKNGRAEKRVHTLGRILSSFGNSVAFSGNTLAIGSNNEQGEAHQIGAVYTQRGAFTPLRRWQPKTVASSKYWDRKAKGFGTSVAVSGQKVYASNPTETVDGKAGAGAVYILEPTAVDGLAKHDQDQSNLESNNTKPVDDTQEEAEKGIVRLTSHTPTVHGYFGLQMQLDDDTLVVTAWDGKSGAEQGALYVLNGGTVERVVHPFGDNSTALTARAILSGLNRKETNPFGLTIAGRGAVRISNGTVAILVIEEGPDAADVVYLKRPAQGLERHVLHGTVTMGLVWGKRDNPMLEDEKPVSFNSDNFYSVRELRFKACFLFQGDTIVVPNYLPKWGFHQHYDEKVKQAKKSNTIADYFVNVTDESGTVEQVGFVGAVFVKRGLSQFERLISSVRDVENVRVPSHSFPAPFGVFGRDGRSGEFGKSIRLQGDTVVISAPLEKVWQDGEALAQAGALYVSRAAGHLKRITSARPTPYRMFSQILSVSGNGESVIGGSLEGGTGAEMISNDVAKQLFKKMTLADVHGNTPALMPATVIGVTESSFVAYGAQPELPLLDAVTRVEELSPSGNLNCSGINTDRVLQGIFNKWEVNTYQGLTDFSRRVKATIPANAWDGGVVIPERIIEFQFLKKEIKLVDDTDKVLGSLHKHMVCAVEAATGSTNCCVGKLLNVTLDVQQEFVSELKMW